ncbi:cyanophycinase [Streptomyces bambusae]|uniref:cyanophycinase n=1 Tax=Streptomyces bambusae TaxID=1550616 RepID=UPI001CFE21EE|nr:cyanophycinase [Streptomyces bambusae]MCB5167000.1 cyanophycinase [Streptomyces bambusae]
MRVPPRPARRAVLTCSIALVLLGAAPAAQAGPGHAGGTGSLVLIGGGLKADNKAVYGEIVKRAGGSAARIGVITAASVPESRDPNAGDPATCSNSACNGAYYVGLFKKHGASEAQWIPLDTDHVANSDDPAVVAQVNSMTGFFFGGGDQYRYITTLLRGDAHEDSAVLAAIRAKLARGAVVAGSSAGAQIASGPHMVSGGESYEGLRDGSTPGYFADPARLGHIPRGGFGFLTSGLIDTHTGAYGREGRAYRLAADTGHDRVYALEENTALIVDAPGSRHERMTVLGPQGVAVLDLRRTLVRSGDSGWGLRGARYSYLTDDDRYHPHSWTAYPATDKRRLRATGTSAVPANHDVFHSSANPAGTPYSFRDTARALGATRTQNSAKSTTFETDPQFTVTFTKGAGFSAWSGDGTSPQTLLGLRIDVARS